MLALVLVERVVSSAGSAMVAVVCVVDLNGVSVSTVVVLTLVAVGDLSEACFCG